ncbi:MAG: nitrous oxide reductase accessory protein NosL [Planctomycetota bacterium]|nr:nitrous oxide reductase accessory protein NosL [Planctomycetota bacterium]
MAIVMIPAGCGEQAADGPPTVRLGDSLCAECNMIISDDRFVTSTLVDGPRGPESRLFDDYICQANYESKHTDLRVFARWSHDYATREWIDTAEAFFVMSVELRAPMASHAAALQTLDAAEHLQATLGGDIVSFETAWDRLQRGVGPSLLEPTPSDSTTPPAPPASASDPSESGS